MTWPWPGDSREDMARRVALSYRAFCVLLLTKGTPDPLNSLRDIDDQWSALGQNWILPSNSPLRLDDWLSAKGMSELLSIPERWIYNWALRKHIRQSSIDGKKVFNVGDVVEYERQRRIKRSGNAGNY